MTRQGDDVPATPTPDAGPGRPGGRVAVPAAGAPAAAGTVAALALPHRPGRRRGRVHLLPRFTLRG